MDKKVATSEDIERLEGEFERIINNKHVQALSDKIAEIEETHEPSEEIKKLLAEVYNNLGFIYFQRNEYDKAIEDFSKAIKLKQGFATAYANRGAVYNILGKHKEAIQDCSEAIKRNPNFVDAYNNRGFAYNELGEYKKAIEDCNEALKRNPDHAETYNNRGFAYFRRDEYRKALEDYSEAIERNPNFVGVHNNRGAVYNALGEYEKTIQDCNEAIKRRLDFTEAYYNRGHAYVRLGKHEKAREDYNKAIKLSLVEKNENIELYRYQPISKQNLQALSRQELWLSSPKCFNDPLDGDYLYEAFTENHVLQKALDGIVIASFQGLPEEQNTEPNCCRALMWSHYGRVHSGICLQFATPKPPNTQKFPSTLTKVKYRAKRQLDSTSGRNLLLEGFAVKGKEWSDESEYRIICHEATESCYTASGTSRTYKELGLELKAIIFGLKCDEADRDIVCKLAPENVGFYQIKQEEKDSFRLCCRPIEKECG